MFSITETSASFSTERRWYPDGWQSYSTTEEIQTSTATNLLWQIVGPLLLVMGLVGHTLSVMTVKHNRSMRRTTSGVLIISLSVVGLISLCAGLIPYFAPNIGEYDLPNCIEHPRCRLLLFPANLTLQLFAWLQAAVAVDRLVAVCTPVRYKTFKQKKGGLAIVGLLCLLACALNITLLVFGELDSFRLAWRYIDLLSFSIIPAIIIAILNMCTVHRITRHKKSSQIKRKTRYVTVMLTAGNLFFIVLTVPASIVLVAETDHPLQSDSSTLLYTCMKLLQYIGTASTFFIYYLTGTWFRHELKLMITCKKKPLPDSQQDEPLTFMSMTKRRGSTMESSS